MKEKDFIEHYRNLVEQEGTGVSDSSGLASSSQKNAPVNPDLDVVWDSISEQLDIDQVWEGISSELDRDRKKILYLRIASMAAAVLLLGGLFLFVDKPIVPVEKPVNLVQGVLEVPHTDVARDSVQLETLFQPNITDTLVYLDSHDQASQADLPSPVAAESGMPQLLAEDGLDAIELFEGVSIKRKPLFFASKFLMDPLLQIKASEDLKMAMEITNPLNAISLEENKKASQSPVYSLSENSTVPKRWSLGAVSALKNTYLLNRETMDGFGASGMNRSHVAVNPDFGLELGYALAGRWQVAAALFFNSPVTQRYDQYWHGEYTSKVIDLKYFAGEMVVKHRAKKSFLLPNHLHRKNVVGLYAAQLHRASMEVQDQKEDISSRYAVGDYGVVLGQEFETRFKGPVNFTAGLRLKMGVPNIYRGDELNSGRFNHTRNAALEVRVGMFFQWGKMYRPINNSIAYIPSACKKND